MNKKQKYKIKNNNKKIFEYNKLCLINIYLIILDLTNCYVLIYIKYLFINHELIN